MEWKLLQLDGYDSFFGYLDGYLDDPDYLLESYSFETGKLADAYQVSVVKYNYYNGKEQTEKNSYRKNLNLENKVKFKTFLDLLEGI